MGELSRDEKRQLAKCETVIEKGKKAFLDVGNALSEIREGRLYRNAFKTFEAYCDEVHGFSKPRAYQFIEAAEVAVCLSTIVDESEVPKKESQLREVAKAPKEKRVDVVQKANERAWSEDREPTAKDFKEAVEELIYEDIPDDDDKDVIDAVVTKSPAEMAIENGQVISQVAKLISEAKRQISSIDDSPGTELLVARRESIKRELESVRGSIVVTVPKAVCPRCKGSGCPQCGNHGWVNSAMQRELEKSVG